MSLRLLIFCLLMFSATGHSQRLIFENIGVKRGLPASEVYNLHQDNKGFIWMFTEFGITKYNGSKFTSVCTNLPAKKRAVYAVAESPSGVMYFANSKNEFYRVNGNDAFRITGKKIEEVRKDINAKSQYVLNLMIDDNQVIWISAGSDSYSIKSKEYKVRSLKNEKPQKRKKAQYFLFKKHSPKTDPFQVSFRYEWCQSKLLSSGVQKVPIWGKSVCDKLNAVGRCIAFLAKNNLCITTSNSVFLGSRNGLITKTLDNEIVCANGSPNGHIWLGTRKGLLEFDEKLNLVNQYFENWVVSNIVFDDQNGMWVSTIGNGVYHCSNINRDIYSNVIGKNERISMLKTIDRELYIGTKNGKLFVQNREGKTREIILPADIVVINEIIHFKKKFYLATNIGLYVSDESLQFKRTLQFDFIYTVNGLTPYDDSHIMIVSGNVAGLYDVERCKFEAFFTKGRSRGAVSQRDGNILSMSALGPISLKAKSVSYPKSLRSLYGIDMYKAVLDGNGDIWFCSRENGLYYLNKEQKITHYSNLPTLLVRDLIFLESGYVVLVSNKTSYYAKRSEMNIKQKWKVLMNDELTAIGEYGNKLFLGTSKGLESIPVDKLEAAGVRRFYIKSIKTKNGPIALGKSLRLRSDQNSLYFEFDDLDFFQKNRSFYYEFSGPESQNGTVIGAELRLQNLSHGDYVLKIFSDVHSKNTGKPLLTKRIIVEPAFWETWIFWFFIVLLFTGSMVFVFSLVVRRRNRIRDAREEIERQLVEYRLTALKSQINPHFMSNSLVAIQNLILQNDVDSANLYLAKFSLLLRTLLDYSNKSYASLKSELALIELYVELEQLRFSNKFRFEIETDPDIDLEETIIPTLVTQPFVENAIWHGLLPLKDHQTATLKLKVFCKGTDMILSIIDNGVGRSFQKKLNKERQSRGTDLIASRIESMNQLYQTTGGRIEIIDLFEDGHASGTRVNIILPKDMLDQLNEKY